MAKKQEDKLALAIAERVNVEQEYQRCCETVVEALRKKRLAAAKLDKAKAEEKKLQVAEEKRLNKARTAKVEQEFLARVKELGCTFDGEHVDAPKGKRFSEGLHHYCLSRDQALDDYLDVLTRLESGVEDCDDPECDWCQPDGAVSSTRLVTCQFCHAETPEATAHRHAGGWVCENDWDERLRVTE